jgi:hypothetical protein
MVIGALHATLWRFRPLLPRAKSPVNDEERRWSPCGSVGPFAGATGIEAVAWIILAAIVRQLRGRSPRPG